MSNSEVPRFHLENNTKKWGSVKTEVLSIYCSKEDAAYLKHVLAEATSQGLYSKGLYVPTGIHLMEGKGVLSSLLMEHQEYIDSVTNFQIEGISYESMKHSINSNVTIQDILMRCQGVMGIEPIYQTDRRGQWNILVQKDKVSQLSNFVKENLSLIYSNRKDKIPKLIERNNDPKEGYKLILVDKSLSKVGTYAEVLTRRFPSRASGSERDTPKHNMEKPTETHNNEKSLAATNQKEGNKTPNTERNVSQGATTSIASLLKDTKTNSVLKVFENNFTTRMEKSIKERVEESIHGIKNQIKALEQNLRANVTVEDTEHIQKTFHKKVEQNNIEIHNTIKGVEQTFSSGLSNLENITRNLKTELENQVDTKIDKIVDSKLRAASQLIADTVTANVIQAFNIALPATYRTVDNDSAVTGGR